MSFRIIAPSSEGLQSDSPELHPALERLDRNLIDSYDKDIGSFRIRFDARRFTILKVLNAIESHDR